VNYYKYLCEKITEGIMQNMSVAMMAIAFWVIKAEGMGSDNLQDIMLRLGFTFDEPAAILTAGGTDYTIYNLLDYCVTSVYPNERTLTAAALKCIIKKCENKLYITAEQRTSLDAALSE